MEAYLNLVKKILKEGVERPNRTGINAITIPHYHFEHDMSSGFPLCTTRKLPYRSTAVELEGFLKGITEKSFYQERKCKYWDYWGNPVKVDEEMTSLIAEVKQAGGYTDEEYRRQIQLAEQDLGPIYGYQWRSFNKTYKGQSEDDGDFHNYTDQLKNVLLSIKNNPNDRRQICSAWNPNQFHLMALPPCHILWKVNILGDKLHLCWFQRSVDTICGLSQNITSYAMLLLLLCKYSGYKPGKLSGFLDDVHIYVNHLDGVKEQLSRDPRPLPTLDIAHSNPFSFDKSGNLQVNWTHKDIALFDYDPHPAIKFEVAV